MDHDPLLGAIGRRYAARAARRRAEADLGVSETDTEPGDGRGDTLRAAEKVLAALDELGEHQAAAYVAMALDAMRRRRPDALPTG